MSLRFPGPAEAATEPLPWQAWTQPTETVRFGGPAVPGTEALIWETRRIDAGPVARTHSEPSVPLRAPQAQQRRPSPAPRPGRTAPQTTVALAPTELLRALADAQQATAQAHATFLSQQQAHLGVLTDAQRILTALLDTALDEDGAWTPASR